MTSPSILVEDFSGIHNRDKSSYERIFKRRTYQDLSTICIIPTRGMVHAKVVQSWLHMMIPMNQKFTRMFIIGMEVGEAYNSAIEYIIAHPELSKWKYVMTLEEDNMPPPDGLLKMYEGFKDFDVIGGLYWTKGEDGQPMIYGDPKIIPLSFVPQLPQMDTIQEACGLGMGFNIYKMEIFKDDRIQKPWFKTVQESDPSSGSKCYSQDLYFYENIRKFGYRVACDTRVKVGHYDVQGDIIW